MCFRYILTYLVQIYIVSLYNMSCIQQMMVVGELLHRLLPCTNYRPTAYTVHALKLGESGSETVVGLVLAYWEFRNFFGMWC